MLGKKVKEDITKFDRAPDAIYIEKGNEGRVIYTCGSAYIGQRKEQRRHGKGQLIGPEKCDLFEGSFVKGRREGFGK